MSSAVAKERVTMKNLRLAALVAVMTALPAIGFAQTTTAPAKLARSAGPAKPAKAATLTVTGVIKSVDATSVVIAPSKAKGAKGPDQTLQLTPSTTGTRTPAVGDVVSVRYQEANGRKTATAVTVKKAIKKQTAGKNGTQ
jgi:hypothetical protein